MPGLEYAGFHGSSCDDGKIISSPNNQDYYRYNCMGLKYKQTRYLQLSFVLGFLPRIILPVTGDTHHELESLMPECFFSFWA